ncbi:ATP-binding protein [Lichenibacterium dinghuense]|uniref:ATP-binding protein n=1 Tax=Lichenibacterium dinghuense TaxID=2895977 RepID=UPI001F2A0C31|nr:ATP-binding protein [Lichenibacterium sp. 6Y81]
MLRPHWPGSLAGRIMLVLLAAVVAQYAGVALIYERAELFRTDADRARNLAERLVLADRLLDAAEPDERARFARLISTPDLAFSVAPAGAPAPAVAAASEASPEAEALRDTLLAAPELEGRDLAVAAGGRGFAGTLRLEDGGAVLFTLRDGRSLPPVVGRALALAAVMAGAVLLVALLTVRDLAGPLRALTGTVDAFSGEAPVRASERGPPDVGRLARAFNAMQERILRLVEDRTRSLAAISHDLRTPLSRMRLRAGFVDDPALRRSFEADVAEVDDLVDSILAYVGEEGAAERPELVDLASLLAAVADNAADLGADAAYEGPARCEARLRATSVRRAATNLVANALHYAGSARLLLDVRAGTLVVRCDDDGPGVPPEALPRLAEPFLRLDAARARNTAGAGLGLAIVKQVVEREGGALRLSNRPGGGFRAEMLLPAR